MPIKILYAHGIQDIGGAETDLIAMIKGLDRERFHPSVACPPNGAFIERLRKIPVPVFPALFPSWRKVKDIWRIPIAVVSWVAILKRGKFDLVHINDYWWTPIVWLACRIRRIPCLVHIRQQIEPRRVKQYWLEKPNGVLAISQEIRHVAIEGGMDPDRIQVVYSGLDFSSKAEQVNRGLIRQRYGLPSGQLLIGAVANLFPRKGYEYLLEALADVRKIVPHVHCIIVGEGDEEYYEKLMNLVRAKDLNEVVTFAGFQPNVLEYMADFDVVVLPSILEGFGIVLLEGMAMGKPVVASRVGGIPEAVEDGVTGILVPPAHSRKLAEALVILLENSMLRQSMGEAGRKRVETLFSLERTIKAIESSYNNILSQSMSETQPTGHSSSRS
jgi:glycosyltransferase involved in cell wall biosynthesis